MRFAIAMGLACMLMGADAPNNAVTSNPGLLNGTWRLTAGEGGGKVTVAAQLQGGKLIVVDNQYTVTLPNHGTVTGTQTLDATKEPKTIDITDTSGPREGQTCLGIYEIKGNEFRVVFATPGEPRPTKFETLPNSGQWMHVWTRIQE